MISVRDISKKYLSKDGTRAVEALRHVSFDIVDPGITVIVGPSGCGKTTLLNILAGLDESFEGEINSLTDRPRKVGYMFQTASLIPWRTVWDNIIIGCEIEKLPEASYRDKAEALLERYDLKEFTQSYPETLSQGMQQRVSLIRLVLFGAELFLLDEPFSKMDYLLRRELYRELNALVDEREVAMVLVTHDIEEAVKLADKVVVFTNRPGHVMSEIEIPVSRAHRINSPPGAPQVAPYLSSVWELLQSSELAIG